MKTCGSKLHVALSIRTARFDGILQNICGYWIISTMPASARQNILDRFTMSLDNLIQRAHSTLADQTNLMSLSIRHTRVMNLLYTEGPNSIQDIDAKLGYTTEETAVLIDQLERNELVQQTTGKNRLDQPTKELTDQGNEAVMRAYGVSDILLGAELGQMNSDNLESATVQLEKLVQDLKDANVQHGAEPP